MTGKEILAASGLTDKEAEACMIAASLWNAFVELPVMNSSDGTEVASAIHRIQDVIMSRPVLRNVAELSKTGGSQ